MVYGKLFAQMYDGTLASRGPWEALVTFQQLIILADQEGIVDMTPEAISRRTTIPQDVIDTGLAALELPDPDSRTPDEEGRRIIRLSDDRGWGWRIVNHGHYRAIRSAEERREYMRNYMKKKRAEKAGVNSDVSKLAGGEQCQPIAVSSRQYAVSNSSPSDDLESSTPNGQAGKYRGTTICTADFVQDLLELERRILKAGGSFTAWLAEMASAIDGMHGPVRSPAEIGQSVRDFNAAGAECSLRLFRGYLGGNRATAGETAGESKPGGKNGHSKGLTLAAVDLIRRVRKAASVPNPYSGTNGFAPGWRETFTALELKVIDAFTPGRILGEKNDSALTSQLRLAMEEASE